MDALASTSRLPGRLGRVLGAVVAWAAARSSLAAGALGGRGMSREVDVRGRGRAQYPCLTTFASGSPCRWRRTCSPTSANARRSAASVSPARWGVISTPGASHVGRAGPQRLRVGHVQRGSDAFGAQQLQQRLGVEDRSPSGVDQQRAGTHPVRASRRRGTRLGVYGAGQPWLLDPAGGALSVQSPRQCCLSTPLGEPEVPSYCSANPAVRSSRSFRKPKNDIRASLRCRPCARGVWRARPRSGQSRCCAA